MCPPFPSAPVCSNGTKKRHTGNPVRLRIYKNATKWSKKIFLKLAVFWARQHHRTKRAVGGPVAFWAAHGAIVDSVFFAKK